MRLKKCESCGFGVNRKNPHARIKSVRNFKCDGLNWALCDDCVNEARTKYGMKVTLAHVRMLDGTIRHA